MHRVSGDAQLPDTKALINLDAVDVQLTPEAITILGDALHQPAASQGGQGESPSKAAGQPAEVMTSGGYAMMKDFTKCNPLCGCCHMS